MAVRLLSNQNVNGDIDVNHSQNAITYVAVTNTNTGVAANSRVQVAGESSQLDLIATSAGYTGVTGWADAGIITTDSGASGGLKLNSQAGGIQLQAGTTTYLTMDGSGYVGINMAPDTAVRLSVSGAIGPTNGTEAAPTHTFYGDSDTGMFRSGADILGFSTNGTTRLTVRASGINVVGKTETDTLLSTGAAQFDTTAQIGSDTTATPELLTVQAYSHNEAFSGKSSATNYIWFLRNENDSGRFQLYNSSGTNTIEFTGADGAATFTGTVDIHATTGDSLLQFNIDGDTYSMGIDNSDSDKFKLSYGVFGNTDLISIAPDGYTIFTGSIIGNNGITLGGSNKTLETLYNNTTSYRGALGWSYLQMGNNGSNDIIGGNTAAGGTLRFFTNNTNFCGADVAPNGNLALTLAADKSATFTGDVEFDKNVWQDISTNGGYIMRPNGADYVTTTGAVTGAIEIRIPTGGAGKDDMIKFVVDIYDYATQESITVFIGGYIYQAIGGNTWTNVSAQIIATDSSKNYKVRFGDNGSVHCVWIGETDSTWSYPQILVRDFYGGFATTVEDYLATWDITYVTSFTTVNNTLTNNFPMSHGGTDDAFWSANGNDIYNDNSGNVGIGTTTPGAQLHNYSTSTQNVWLSGYGTLAQNTWGAGHAIFAAQDNGLIISKANAANDTNRLFTFYHDSGGNGEQYIYDTSSTVKIKLDSAGTSYFNGGDVGIGTSSPAALLNLSQAAGANIRFDNETTTNYFTIGEGVGTNNVFSFRGNSYRSTDTLSIDFANNRVGVGAISPDATFQVGNGTANVLQKIWGSGTAGIQIFTNSPSTGTKIASLEQYFSNEGYLGLYYDGTEKVRLRANDTSFFNGGKVGIGATSPGRMLHVNGGSTQDGGIKLETTATASNFWSGIEFKTPNSTGFIYVSADDTAGTIKFVPAGTIKASLNATSFICAGDVVAYGSPSDITLKKNIKPLENSLDKISKLNGVSFTWKNPGLSNIVDDIGFIAQDVQKVLPKLVRENEDGKLSMRHQGVIPILVEAIKELKAEIEELKKNK
tara:strand:+ start:7001 stop:10132 length:3132 start_codon:yes stop_codon:yes gene_type:complete